MRGFKAVLLVAFFACMSFFSMGGLWASPAPFTTCEGIDLTIPSGKVLSLDIHQAGLLGNGENLLVTVYEGTEKSEKYNNKIHAQLLSKSFSGEKIYPYGKGDIWNIVASSYHVKLRIQSKEGYSIDEVVVDDVLYPIFAVERETNCTEQRWQYL